MTAMVHRQRVVLLGLVTLLFVLAAAPACSFAAAAPPSDMTGHTSHGCETSPENPGACPRASEMHPDATVTAPAPVIVAGNPSPLAIPPLSEPVTALETLPADAAQPIRTAPLRI